ncbi:MAG: TVP38/TMEM64 family protein [Acidobacteriota bacterium]
MGIGSLSRASAIKAALLVLFIAAAIGAVRFSPLGEVLSRGELGRLIETSGPWAPLIFIVAYAAGICMFVPGLLLTSIGAALFGPYEGFVYVWIGAVLGAGLAFLIARYLGRDLVASMIGDRLRKYDDAIEREGFATVLYLRLVYLPFTLLSFGMGLTKVRFRDYLSATAIGIAVGTFVLTFLIGSIKEEFAAGRWEQLLSWRILLAVCLFVASLFIPKAVKRFSNRRES